MGIGKFRQFHTAIACGFGSLMISLVISWPSYTSELYLSNTTTPLSAPMTKGEEALLGSLPSLGAMLGSALPAFLIDRLGRRNTGVLLYLPIVLSWAIVSATTSITVVLAARFVAGLTGGASLVLTPIFVSEIAEDSIRGTLASASIFLYYGGTLISYAIGWCFTYRTIIWINLFITVTGTVLMALVTESPMYFIKHNKEEDAKYAIAKYRGVSVSSMVVLDELSKFKQQIMPSIELVPITDKDPKSEKAGEMVKLKIDEEAERDEPQSMSALRLLFCQPGSRWAFTVVSTVISCQVFMGCVPVQVFAKSVFQQTDPSFADIYTIIFAVILFIGTGFSAVMSDKAGRRSLIISSSVLVFLSMGVLGFLIQSKIGPPLVTVIIIFIYCFSFMFGAGSIPYVLLAEAFIPEVQNLASMIIIELVWFHNFVIIAIFPFMNSALGIYGTFYCFSFVAFVNAIFAYFYVPETKGLSNAQIQDLFMSRKKR